MYKNYEHWTPIKIFTNNNLDRPINFREGQVWRCKIGENIGVEMDGKGNNYLRPVLIIKRYGDNAFLGAPLTSKTKPNRPFYHPIRVGNRDGLIIISQLRFWDASRLTSLIQQISHKDFLKIKQHLASYLGLK